MATGKMKMLAATALIALVAGAAAAQGPGNGPRMGFETLDTDGSGEITLEDFSAQREARFAELDANGDGSVSRDEFVAAQLARAEERAGAMFDRLDADGDGVLSRDVLEARQRGVPGERMLERFDADGSGGISEEEFDAARERFAEHRGGREGHEGGWFGRHRH